jgi:hypothetical protein
MLQTMGVLATLRSGGTNNDHAHNLVVVGSSPTRPTEKTRCISTGFRLSRPSVQAP